MEIEKKYLLKQDGETFATPVQQAVLGLFNWDEPDTEIRQGYVDIEYAKEYAKENLGIDILFPASEARLRDQDGRLTFTFKSEGTLKRHKVEIPIEQKVFDELWPRTEGARIHKVRYITKWHKHIIKSNVYQDRDLVVAEVEFMSEEEAEKFSTLGRDVTEDVRYKNRSLAR